MSVTAKNIHVTIPTRKRKWTGLLSLLPLLLLIAIAAYVHVNHQPELIATSVSEVAVANTASQYSDAISAATVDQPVATNGLSGAGVANTQDAGSAVQMADSEQYLIRLPIQQRLLLLAMALACGFVFMVVCLGLCRRVVGRNPQ